MTERYATQTQDSQIFIHPAGAGVLTIAAHQAAEHIRNERTRVIHYHRQHNKVTHADIALPENFGKDSSHLTRDRASLWNAAIKAGPDRNHNYAYQYRVQIPRALRPEERI